MDLAFLSMKYAPAFRPASLAAVALSLASLAEAQVVELVGVSKLKFHEQTSATQVALLPAAELPFGIDLNVDGTDIHLLSPAPTVSGPISNPEPNHNGGVLGINPNYGYWQYGYPNFDNWGTATLSELETLFGSGTYTFNVAGSSVPVNLSGDLYPATAPLLTLSGGTWTNGIYSVLSDRDLTITTNAYAAYGSNLEDAVHLGVYGPGVSLDTTHIASFNAQNFISITIPANTLLAGNSYEVDSAFIAASDFSVSFPAFPGALIAAGYEMVTFLTVEVLPPAPGIAYCFGDGAGTLCPCGNNNDGSNGVAGCANGFSSGGAAVTGSGTASVSGDTVVLSATGLQPNQPGLWFQANNAVNGGLGNAFGDGLRCAGGQIVRLGIVISDGTGSSTSPAGIGAGLSAGDTKRYQLWYRNPGGSPCGTAFNLSNGYEIHWTL